jgi:hypothetical protein
MRVKLVCDCCGSDEGSEANIKRMSEELDKTVNEIHQMLWDGVIHLEGATVVPVLH